MTLFTKPDCIKCHYITKQFNLKKLGIKIEVLEPENADALAHLAWHELIDIAEKELPILVLDDMTYIIGTEKIKTFLNQLSINA